jgi:hypothetical protein
MVSQLSTRPLEQITSTRIHRLHDYWQSRRLPGQPFVYRKDIDPADLRELLPLLSIADVEYAPLRFRYRLVGTRVVEYNHQEFTGLYLGEVGWQEEAMLLGAYEMVVVDRRPNYGFYAWDLRSGGIGKCEFGMFPLTQDGETIHQVFAIEDYEFPVREVDPARV